MLSGRGFRCGIPYGCRERSAWIAQVKTLTIKRLGLLQGQALQQEPG